VADTLRERGAEAAQGKYENQNSFHDDVFSMG
jgi:hypothetical protein